jgi:hypothetical protein
MELDTKLSRYDKKEEMDVNLYRSLTESLRYLTCTRPDIAFIIGVASRNMESPIISHWKTVKMILRYVQGIVDIRLHYLKTNNFKFADYSDRH